MVRTFSDSSGMAAISVVSIIKIQVYHIHAIVNDSNVGIALLI